MLIGFRRGIEHACDVGRDLIGAGRRLLDVARDLRGRGALLLDGAAVDVAISLISRMIEPMPWMAVAASWVSPWIYAICAAMSSVAWAV